MSTKPSSELEELVKSSGADGYIQKPFNDLSLVSQVQRLVLS
jgi:CheY-like chemotaxis protein